jgi:Na+-driven multidrug efflux pump
MDNLLAKIRSSWLATSITVVVLWLLAESLLSWFVSFAPVTALAVALVVLLGIALLVGAWLYVLGGHSN